MRPPNELSQGDISYPQPSRRQTARLRSPKRPGPPATWFWTSSTHRTRPQTRPLQEEQRATRLLANPPTHSRNTDRPGSRRRPKNVRVGGRMRPVLTLGARKCAWLCGSRRDDVSPCGAAAGESRPASSSRIRPAQRQSARRQAGSLTFTSRTTVLSEFEYCWAGFGMGADRSCW